MTTFEIRRCDTCGRTNSRVAKRAELIEAQGWQRDRDGADVCPVCLWVEESGRDAVPTPEILADVLGSSEKQSLQEGSK